MKHLKSGNLNISLFIDLSLTNVMLWTVNTERSKSWSLFLRSPGENIIQTCVQTVFWDYRGKSQMVSQKEMTKLRRCTKWHFAHSDLPVKFDNGLCFGEKARRHLLVAVHQIRSMEGE